MTRGFCAMARTRETMGMKVKDVVGAFEFSDECFAVVTESDLVGEIEFASEDVEPDLESPYWDSEVASMEVWAGRLVLTLK